MTFPSNIISATPPKYRFKLISGDKSIICDPEPIEWASGVTEIDRDIKVGGVFSSYQSETLTFVGNGADLLEFLFTNYELGAECTFHVYWWKSSIREYVEFANSFNIDFNFYEKVYVGKFGIGVKVKAVNSSIKAKFENRKDIDVDLTRLISIGDSNISDFPSLKKNLYFDATNVSYYTYWYSTSIKGVNYWLPRKPGYISYTSIPLNVGANDFEESQAVSYITKITDLGLINSFFNNALFDYEFTFTYSFWIDVVDKDSTTPWSVKLLEVNPDNEIQNTHTLTTLGTEKGSFNTTGILSITLSQGNSLKFVVEVQNRADIKAAIRDVGISLLQSVVNSPSSTTEGLPIYESLLRCSQLILDEQYPLYSEKFGRSGIIYDESGNQYSFSDQKTYAHIQTGLNQRGLPNTDENNPIAVNFEDLFNTANCCWNLGYGFELISGKLRLRIEDYSHFFQDELILDLSSRVNKYDIVSAVMPELVPSEIKSGFNNFEYKEANGRGEPNTTSIRTTKINTSTKYEIIAPYRGDTMGILQNIANPITTEDVENDSDIFIVKTQSYSDGWKPEKNENITIDANSLFEEDLLNRYFLPSRMVVRHGNRINSGLRLFPSSYLRFQKSDKAQNLKTTGDGYTISENDNILINNLSDPIYKPISHTVEVSPFDWADLQSIQENPYGYIKFTDSVYGYLLNLKKKNNEAKAEITIIEKI